MWPERQRSTVQPTWRSNRQVAKMASQTNLPGSRRMKKASQTSMRQPTRSQSISSKIPRDKILPRLDRLFRLLQNLENLPSTQRTATEVMTRVRSMSSFARQRTTQTKTKKHMCPTSRTKSRVFRCSWRARRKS